MHLFVGDRKYSKALKNGGTQNKKGIEKLYPKISKYSKIHENETIPLDQSHRFLVPY